MRMSLFVSLYAPGKVPDLRAMTSYELLRYRLLFDSESGRV